MEYKMNNNNLCGIEVAGVFLSLFLGEKEIQSIKLNDNRNINEIKSIYTGKTLGTINIHSLSESNINIVFKFADDPSEDLSNIKIVYVEDRYFTKEEYERVLLTKHVSNIIDMDSKQY